ncbi:MAG: SPOR domain-containing protein [Pseudomonadales bacterium]|nr:SPOR domain-containing protein [Pseudomonadales bacterium]
MAHDFAKIRSTRRTEPATPPPPPPSKGMLLTGLFTGLALGFFSSFLIYLSGILPPVGEMQVQTPQEREAEVLAAQQRRNEELEQAAARLQLEFYKELPNYEVIVDNMPGPRSAPATSGSSPTPAAATVTASPAATPPADVQTADGSFMIQAGAFAQESSALTQSERLNSLGLPARIKKEALLGKTLFLVQAGPYPSREQANQAERILRSNGIDSIRIGLNQ